jgi:hypothetical protein
LIGFTGPRQHLPGAFFWRKKMWKIVVGFVVFAGLALYMLSKGGDIDMSGEKHGVFKANASVMALLSVQSRRHVA